METGDKRYALPQGCILGPAGAFNVFINDTDSGCECIGSQFARLVVYVTHLKDRVPSRGTWTNLGSQEPHEVQVQVPCAAFGSGQSQRREEQANTDWKTH